MLLPSPRARILIYSLPATSAFYSRLGEVCHLTPQSPTPRYNRDTQDLDLLKQELQAEIEGPLEEKLVLSLATLPNYIQTLLFSLLTPRPQ